jgi:glutathione synthase/RimK-type ligase-like ATP-grasp enzyme
MFLFRRKGGLSAIALADLIGCKCAKNSVPSNEFIINYGQSYRKANLNANVNFNKVEVQRILEENGIRVPKMIKRGSVISKKDYPVLARKNYHSRGKDIIFIENEKDLNRIIDSIQCDYFVKYIEKKKEYRVHILGNYKTIVNVKIPKKDEEQDDIIWSHDKGWIHIEYHGEFREKLIKIAKDVLKILKYDFGAVDIILGEDGCFYVLEINSAPGLEDRKLQIYAEYFLHEEKKIKTVKEQVKAPIRKEPIKPKEEIINQGIYAWRGKQ